MEAGSRTQRGVQWQGVVLGIVLWLLTGATIWLVGSNLRYMPSPLGNFALQVDQVIRTILVVALIGIVTTHLYLGWVLLQSGRQERAFYYPARQTKEWLWVLIPISCLLAADLYFDHLSNKVWNAFFSKPPENAFLVEVTAQQFAWNIRYPGKDGRFGRTDPKFISDFNPLGIAPDDPAGKDDILLTGEMHVPVNRPVVVNLRARDVLHSFFLPHTRLKMDCVPGMTTRLWFIPDRKGNFEIACAELCGMGHYNMKGLLVVEEQSAVDKWLAQQIPFGGQ